MDLEAYEKTKEAWLRQFLVLPHGIPSHGAFAGVLESVVHFSGAGIWLEDAQPNVSE